MRNRLLRCAKHQYAKGPSGGGRARARASTSTEHDHQVTFDARGSSIRFGAGQCLGRTFGGLYPLRRRVATARPASHFVARHAALGTVTQKNNTHKTARQSVLDCAGRSSLKG